MFDRPSALCVSALLATGACTGGAPAGTTVTTTVEPTPWAREALARGVAALSTDDRGVPRLVRAVRSIPATVGARPDAAARAHLAMLAPAYVGGGTPARLAYASTHALDGGASIVTMRQEVGGVPILHGDLRVMIDRDGALLAVSGTVRAADPASRSFVLSDADAMAAALDVQFGAAQVTLGDSITKQVLFPDGDTLVAAWLIEAYASIAREPEAAFRVVVAADDGRVLERADLTANDAVRYRVFADADAAGRPFEGPQASFAPHPTGAADGSQPAFVAPNLVTMEAFNDYRDPWLDVSATSTRGNNADAYADLGPGADGFTEGVDLRATLTAPGELDRAYDTHGQPGTSPDQRMAAVTQLFYTVNWLHDWYYDAGFDEAAGNAQAVNWGRGGVEGDAIRAEAQDNALGGSRNNANMSTPADGLSPRMQMYLWGGASTHSLVSSAIATPMAHQIAAFGPTSFELPATPIVLGDTACAAITAPVAGAILLVDRGGCTFEAKVQRAQQAGAIGVLVANNAPAGLPGMGDDATITGVTIPSFGISQADGATIRATPGATATLVRFTDVERDGDLDNTVIAHEWGHYLHHRLSDCSGPTCGAMSEGWGDFVALHLALRPEDDPHGVYPLAVYDTGGQSDPYYGIRRAPYSVDATRNGLTFGHIKNGAALPATSPPTLGFGTNAEVHNAGEVWAAMLWEVYVALIDARGYEVARRAMSDYVVAGLQLMPPNPSWTEARDAIVLAIDASSPDDAAVAIQAFASRGVGSCADAPAVDDAANAGVVERFEVSGRLAIGAVTLSDDRTTCDGDGVLDAGETGTLTVQVANTGAARLTGTRMRVTTATPGVTITPPEIGVPALAPWAEATRQFTVRFDPDVVDPEAIGFEVLVEDDDACAPVAATAAFDANFDDDAAVSATDADSDRPAWTATGDAWSRARVGLASRLWHGADRAFRTDATLTSPPLVVGDDSAPFVVTFAHAYQFEHTAPATAWDGAVIELSTDDGVTWADVTAFGVTPGYTGAVNGGSGNVLEGRAAYVGASPGYPALVPATIDLGTQLAGQTVRLRFRIGTDSAAGAGGWRIDDVSFAHIVNTPFGAITPEDPTCQAGPAADAGPDQLAVHGAWVGLDGTGSTDPNDDPIDLTWTQIGGPPVILSDPHDSAPMFVAPDASVDLRLTFHLTVADPWASDTDTVIVDVDVDNTPPPPPPPPPHGDHHLPRPLVEQADPG